MFENLQGSSLDRRSFLRGSAMFAAAIGVSVLPAFAQEQKPQQPKPEEDEKKKEEPKDPFGDGEKKDEERSSSTPRAANTASARSAPTTCTSRAACGCARTAVTATSSKPPIKHRSGT